MNRLQRAVNLYVDRNYECSDPVQDMENKLRDWGYPLSGCAGLMTAVPLEHAAVAEEDTGSAGIFVCVTAAAGNAARSGVERNVLAVYRPGTINIMLCIDGRLTPAAMVNAVQTAVEAKGCCAGRSRDYRSGEWPNRNRHNYGCYCTRCEPKREIQRRACLRRNSNRSRRRYRPAYI